MSINFVKLLVKQLEGTLGRRKVLALQFAPVDGDVQLVGTAFRPGRDRGMEIAEVKWTDGIAAFSLAAILIRALEH